MSSQFFPCAFNDVGCDALLTSENADRHYNVDAEMHISLLRAQCNLYKSKISQVETALQSAQSRARRIDMENSSLRQELACTQSELAELKKRKSQQQQEPTSPKEINPEVSKISSLIADYVESQENEKSPEISKEEIEDKDAIIADLQQKLNRSQENHQVQEHLLDKIVSFFSQTVPQSLATLSAHTQEQLKKKQQTPPMPFQTNGLFPYVTPLSVMKKQQEQIEQPQLVIQSQIPPQPQLPVSPTQSVVVRDIRPLSLAARECAATFGASALPKPSEDLVRLMRQEDEEFRREQALKRQLKQQQQQQLQMQQQQQAPTEANYMSLLCPHNLLKTVTLSSSCPSVDGAAL